MVLVDDVSKTSKTVINDKLSEFENRIAKLMESRLKKYELKEINHVTEVNHFKNDISFLHKGLDALQVIFDL